MSLLTGVAAAVRVVALAWLLIVGPAELATTVARLLPRLLAESDPALVTVVIVRGLTVAVGVATGLALLRRLADVRRLATVWGVAESATLAIVLFTPIVPTNRLPGSAPYLAVLHAGLIASVLAASRQQEQPSAGNAWR